MAFSGQSDPNAKLSDASYHPVIVDLRPFVGRGDTFRLRFRFATDQFELPLDEPGEGWFVDEVVVCQMNGIYFPFVYKGE